MKLREVAEAAGISIKQVYDILLEYLDIKNYVQDGCHDCSNSTISATM